MKQNQDTIQFESRREIEKIQVMIAKYVEQNPEEKKNETIKELYQKLEVMHMAW